MAMRLKYMSDINILLRIERIILLTAGGMCHAPTHIYIVQIDRRSLTWYINVLNQVSKLNYSTTEPKLPPDKDILSGQ